VAGAKGNKVGAEMSDLLTPEELNQIGFGGMQPALDIALLVAQAQINKLVDEGRKSGEECGRCTHTSEFARQAVQQARIDERKAIGKWLVHRFSTTTNAYLAFDRDVDTLLKGKRP
jgi:hypothetical protein